MLNRRKALIGWTVYSAGKPIAKYAIARKAKQVASQSGESAHSGGSKIAKRVAALIVVAGGILVWRSRSGKDDDGADDVADSGTDL